MLRHNHDEPTQPSRQAIHKANAQVPRRESTIHYRDTLTYPTTASSQTLNTNTTASSELLSMTANIKNKTCYVKRCSVHHATSTAIPRHWYRQAATRTLANNTSQNKPTQQQSQTCKFASMSWKVSSHGALGVAPSARTARTVICRV